MLGIAKAEITFSGWRLKLGPNIFVIQHIGTMTSGLIPQIDNFEYGFYNYLSEIIGNIPTIYSLD